MLMRIPALPLLLAAMSLTVVKLVGWSKLPRGGLPSLSPCGTRVREKEQIVDGRFALSKPPEDDLPGLFYRKTSVSEDRLIVDVRFAVARSCPSARVCPSLRAC